MMELLLAFVVSVLVEGLGDRHFPVRQHSHATLEWVNNTFDCRDLLKPHLESKDPEVRTRVDRILRAYTWVKTSAGYCPRYDFLHVANETLSKEEQQLLMGTWGCGFCGHVQYIDRTFRQMTLEYVSILFKQGKTRRQVLNILERGLANEQHEGRNPE